MEIKNKRVVVTGAASGIGRALCEEFFANEVQSIVCVDMNIEGAEETAKNVNGIAISADVSEEKNIINVIDYINKDEINKLRDRSIILIGFSGGFRRNELVSLDFEDLDFVDEGLKVNVKKSKTDLCIGFGNGL